MSGERVRAEKTQDTAQEAPMSTLREEVERAMREKLVSWEREDETVQMWLSDAVSVAVALVEGERRERGHVYGCHCCGQFLTGRRQDSRCAVPTCDHQLDHDVHDPRCAPLPGEETR